MNRSNCFVKGYITPDQHRLALSITMGQIILAKGLDPLAYYNSLL